MKKLFTLFFTLVLGLGQVFGATLYGKVAVGSGKGTATVDIYNGYNQKKDSKSTTGSQVSVSYGMSIVSWGYCIFTAEAATGYVFDAWYTNSACTSGKKTDNPYQTETSQNSARTDEYWAKFNPIKYTIAFNGNGAETGSTPSVTNVEYDKAATLNANGFVRNRYTVSFVSEGGAIEPIIAHYLYDSWNTKADGTGTKYAETASVINLTSTNNATVTLYAYWTGTEKITLPSAGENGTYLFSGWYNGEEFVGYAGDGYTPTDNVTLTAHWVEVATPSFSIDDDVIELGQTTRLALTNVDNPSIQFEPENIVSYDMQAGTLTGIAVGEVTIKINQEATPTINAKYEELTLTVTKKTPSLSVKLNNVDRTSVTIYQGETASVVFDKESDAEVVVTTVSGAKSASYADGVVTAGEIGTAVFRATLPETETYKGMTMDFSVVVERNPIHLPLTMSSSIWNNDLIKVVSEGSNSWDDSNGIVLGDKNGGGGNWDDKYVILHFEGIPDKLTFEISTDAIGIGQSLGGATKVEWFVKESATANMPNDKIWTESRTDNSFSDTYTVQLQPSTRYILLCYSGNFAGYFRNVQISELKYVQDPEPANIDFGTAVIGTGEVNKTVNVNWCNIAPMSVVSSNPRFTVSPATFGNYDEIGSQEITISYTHTDEVGAQEADITISNGNNAYTKTVHVSAKTTKRVQTVTWNPDLVSTGFAMNVGESYPDEFIAAIATTQSGELITFTTSNSDIIEVVDDTILVAKAVGTVEITAHQAGDDEYEAVSDTKEFTVTNLQKQSITWDQNLYGLLTTDEPIELTATATSGMEITYSSNDENVVRIEGNMLFVVGEGETTITATQAGGEDSQEVEWLAVSQENFVIVRNPASQCNGMSLSVGSLTLKSGSLEKEYALDGFPTSLTFSAKHGTKENGAWGQSATYAALMVDEYTKVDGVWGWKTIFNQVVGTDATSFGPIELDEIATKVRFRTTESGTEHSISNIRVPRKKFMRTDVNSIDESIEANAIWSKQITVSHSNIDLMTVTAKQGLIAFNTATLGAGCGDYGDDTFVASFAPAEKNREYSDTIVITDGKAEPSTIEIPVHFVSTGLNQTLSSFDIPATCLTTETVEMPVVTASSNLEVVFLSSDSTVAYVENKELKINKAGTVDIIAYQAGNDKYNEVSVAKTIEIQLTPVDIILKPTASPVGAGLTVGTSVLKGGSASVDGTFRWADPDALVEEGEHSYGVLFIPEADSIYATATTEVTLNGLEEETTYGELTIYLCDGDAIEIDGTVYDEAFDDDILLEEPNMFGGDSILHLTIIVVYPDYVELFDTLKVGDVLQLEEDDWNMIAVNGEALENVIPMGTETQFTAPTTLDIEREAVNVHGCDSVTVRHITVEEEKNPSTGCENVQQSKTAVKELRNGVLYIRREGKEFTIDGRLAK